VYLFVYFRELATYRTPRPAVSVCISQRGLVAVGYGRNVQVRRNVLLRGAERRGELYVTHQLPADVTNVEFSPFEDCLGIGHAQGFSSILVPGLLRGGKESKV